MTASPSSSLGQLARDFPEWRPWLKIVEVVLREAADPRWDGFVPTLSTHRSSHVPMLSGTKLILQRATIDTWIGRLMKSASQSGAPKISTLSKANQTRLSTAEVFKSSLCPNHDRLSEIAAGLGADAEAFQSVGLLASIPFLQACNRRWTSSIAESWSEGYCPVCGVWPAFAEVRGIERSRHLRCGRCGAGWQTHCLSCPYCGTTDHKKLHSLVPEKDGSRRIVDACEDCGGYLKVFTKL